jgi:hypothetical protein
MSPEIPLAGQRPAEYVFSKHVESKLEEIKSTKREPAMVEAD